MSCKLIALEGIDGSGKSTMIKFIKSELERSGYEVVSVQTREEEQEELFAEAVSKYAPDENSPAYMFFFQVLHALKAEKASKALGSGKIVVADRWDLSFFVYHENFGFFSKESESVRESVSRFAFQGLKPDLGIYLDVSVTRALERRVKRGELISDVEAEIKFYTKVTDAYRGLAQRHGWIAVDANGDFNQVKQLVWELVQNITK